MGNGYGYASQHANRNRGTRGYYARRPKVEKPAHLTDPALLDRINALAVNEAADDWTRNFCTSIAEGFKKYKGLTQKQFDIFVKQEHRATPEFAQARDEWRANYDESKRNIARVCAEYYKANPPYFGDLADKVLTDPAFIPTPRQYRAMCENKYAKKVLKSATCAPAFSVGQIVELRATARGFARHFPLGKGAIIEIGAAPVKSAAKGSKVYKILPLGSAETVEIEERHIKKARGLK
jgi:hypothetical protein